MPRSACGKASKRLLTAVMPVDEIEACNLDGVVQSDGPRDHIQREVQPRCAPARHDQALTVSTHHQRALGSYGHLRKPLAQDFAPRLADRLFLTDGGLETTLIFHNQLELPCFAAFDLLREDAGMEILRRYFDPYIEAARRHGRLPSGDTLADAIQRTDQLTDGYAAYYMINCAHPRHFVDVLQKGGAWLRRIRGVRANASTRSHAELDESTNLDAGDPQQLAREYAQLLELLPMLNVLGGCCGTDHRHLSAIAAACIGKPAASDERRPPQIKAH